MIDLHLSAFSPRWRFLYAVRIDAYRAVIFLLSDPTANLLAAAAVDLNALIRGAGESWIAELKKE